jgi:hypothetical protein
MKIVSGIDAFHAFASAAEAAGPWPAWREHCFEPFREVYMLILRLLYQTQQVDVLRQFIEQMDLEKARERVRRFVDEDVERQVQRLLESAEQLCPISTDYSVYLLPGWGHIDGLSLPGREPFVYFGLEMHHSRDYLESLVPHEYNHMVRNVAVLAEELQRLGRPTLKHLMIGEGLATLFPVVLHGESIEPSSIVAGRMMSEDAATYCIEHEEELFEELSRVWNEEITPELMKEYMSAPSGWLDDKPAKTAYYVGSRIIGDLINQGYDVCTLTRMPTEAIWQLYEE